MSLASQVLVGLALGIVTGVAFGEAIAFVGIVGRAFILLLQMAVLPFVAVALSTGLGGLSPRGWRSLLRHAGGFLVLIWAVTLVMVVASPFAFPNWPAASFFSATLVEEHEAFDFLGLYIPSNPFRSLAEGVVPAVVVFSLAFGIALMGSERKQPLLQALLAAQDALRRITSAVVRLAPYGIFAIAAEAAGTTAPERLAGLQVYVVTYIGLSLLLAFWVLPMLVAAVTPLRYRDVLGPARDALVTAFATGSLFLVLPLVADRARTLLAERGADEEAQRQADVVVPMAFTLAGAGKLLGLVFVLYAGWQSGFAVSPFDYAAFAGTGLFSSFAGSAVSLPFMLDLFRIPSDMFQLYLVVDSVIGGRFSALTGSMHTFALALLAGSGTAAWVRVEPRRFLPWIASSLVAAAALLGAVRLGFETRDTHYTGYRAFIERSFLLPTVPWREREGLVDEPPAGPRDTLQRVRARGALRVGYAPDRLPFAFRNAAGELVGFDAEMAHALARDLGVRVEFVRTSADDFPALLDAGTIDVVMTGLLITPERLEKMRFSSPILQETLAFIVRDHRRNQFRAREALRSIPDLHLAVPGRGYYEAKVQDYLPDARITVVDSPRVFFRAEEGAFDAMVFAAETGSAWTLIYPQFSVAVPHPDVLRVPVGYATASDDRRMAEFIDAWILLKHNDRTIERLFAYWFEGEEPAERKRRWSFARDVLGWGAPAPEPEAPARPAAPTPPPAPEPATPAPPDAEDRLPDFAPMTEGEAEPSPDAPAEEIGPVETQGSAPVEPEGSAPVETQGIAPVETETPLTPSPEGASESEGPEPTPQSR
ncbi:MAG: cation:dicarboxylase symporter family transporter [Myxococcota bacterium]|nr:cation:dicarboxylase symporter family transporter [Myxococcota bacterium]